MRTLVAATLVVLAAFGGAEAGEALSAKGFTNLALDSDQVLAAAQTGRVTVRLPTGPMNLELEPNPLAWGALIGADGVSLGTVDETVTFKGTAGGAPVRLAATRAGVFAAILDEDPIFIQPVSLAPAWGPTPHTVLRWSDNPPIIPDHPDPSSSAAPRPIGLPMVAPPSAGRVARVLVESDYEFVKKFQVGGVTCTECWVQTQQALFNIIEGFYHEQVGIDFQLTSQWACTTPTACEYPSLPASMSQWKLAFKTKWESNATEPAHDLGYLFISKNLPSLTGVAFEPGVGTPDGYAVSEVFADPFAFQPPDFGIVQYAVAAHEVGHLFNGTHSHAHQIPWFIAPDDVGAYTMMTSGEIVQFRFSDGRFAGHDNAARIVSMALEKLPPP